jgi:hypothetical protein
MQIYKTFVYSSGKEKWKAWEIGKNKEIKISSNFYRKKENKIKCTFFFFNAKISLVK